MQVLTWCESLDGLLININNLVSMKDLKLVGMKSHDCHVMMTQMLPIAIWCIKLDYIKLVAHGCVTSSTLLHIR